MTQPHTAEPLDTRTLFRVYEAVALFGGIACVLWGPMFFPPPLADYPFGAGFVCRIAGFAVMALAPLAQAARLVEAREDRKTLLTLWAVGHAILLAGLLFQSLVIMGTPGPGTRFAVAILATGVVLFGYARSTVDGMPWGALVTSHQTLFGDPRERPSAAQAELRSAYEEQIRAAAAQEERNRLARELHDSIKQQLFVIQTAAATAQARYGADDSGALEAVERVRSSAREAMTEMEVMLDQLRAAPLESTGLVEAVKRQCEALRFRTAADVRFSAGPLPLPEQVRPGTHETLFRIVQEALANVARHARATTVTVALDASESEFTLSIQDDGQGFDTTGNARSSGMGIGNIRARAEAAGGRASVTSVPGEGTFVRVAVPLVSETAASPAAYGSLFLYWGATLVIWICWSAWDIISPRRRFELSYVIPLTIVHAWLFGRVVRSYLVARRSRDSKKASIQ